MDPTVLAVPPRVPGLIASLLSVPLGDRFERNTVSFVGNRRPRSSYRGTLRTSFDSLSVWYKDNTSHYTFGYSSNGSSVSQLAKTYAGFGSAEYTIGQFTLKGGARYTQADRSAVNCLFALNDNGQTINLIN